MPHFLTSVAADIRRPKSGFKGKTRLRRSTGETILTCRELEEKCKFWVKGIAWPAEDYPDCVFKGGI
jgi:hypothetical protein